MFKNFPYLAELHQGIWRVVDCTAYQVCICNSFDEAAFIAQAINVAGHLSLEEMLDPDS